MEYGTLKVGALGDATVLSVRDGAFDYVDTRGEHMTGAQRIFSEGVVLRGRWWHPVWMGGTLAMTVRDNRTGASAGRCTKDAPSAAAGNGSVGYSRP